MHCQEDFANTPWRLFSATCRVWKVISFIGKFVFQDFREVFTEKKKNESIYNSVSPDSFQFPGKIASNILQILNIDLINIAVNRSPIYMLRCAVSDDK